MPNFNEGLTEDRITTEEMRKLLGEFTEQALTAFDSQCKYFCLLIVFMLLAVAIFVLVLVIGLDMVDDDHGSIVAGLSMLMFYAILIGLVYWMVRKF
mmetsp:Transcript_25349/g.22389  ORF Transcript_25349/g.22389 Transcript_25349/m.22389 type:complete len:97 (+) Transcript_25349:604-894(+)